MKKVSKPLNGSTNRLVKKTSFTFQKCENNWSLKWDFANSQHSKSKKTAPNFEMKEDIQPWRQETEDDGSLPTHKSESWHHPIKVATIRLDQKAISPKKTRGFLIQICENPDLISKNWYHRSLLRPSIYQT